MSTQNHFSLILQNVADAQNLPSEAEFALWCSKALEHGLSDQQLKVDTPWEITVRIVEASESQNLNREYRHKDYPTNVLSFDYEDPFSDLNFEDDDHPGNLSLNMGDIVICSSIVEKEAEEQAIPLRDHYAHLTVHASLHLLGYDHEDPQEAEKMESLEINILHTLSFNNPYEGTLIL